MSIWDTKDTLHPVEDFARFPWDKLDPERCGKDWSISRGGRRLSDETYTINIYDRECNADIWVCPASLGALFEMCKRVGANSATHDIRVAVRGAMRLIGMGG
jgi:hypothetical protein